MPEPRAFKLRQAENRPNHYTGALPEIDRKRATAVLVRQSKDGCGTLAGKFKAWEYELPNSVLGQ
jgi:hypothetical protein